MNDAVPRQRAVGRRAAVVISSYLVLGSLLCWSRFVGLNHGYASDELMTVKDYVGEGPHKILFGHYIPNNHELFSLLAWVTSTVVGESEVAFRLWSVVPFLAGVALVTTWLHRRLGPLSGLLFLFFATVSPLLLDITRQARGYGLAFFAMSVLVVAALEAVRSYRIWTVVAFCAAGVLGTWTLPQFGLAYVATGAVLLTHADLRRRAALGLAVSLLAIGVWYSPHFEQVRDAARIEDGVRIETLWLVTAPIDQVLIPALVWIDGTALVPGLVWLPLVLAAAFVMGSSPLLHERWTALVLSSGVVATIVALWLGRAYIVPRYLSYLLVPLLIVLATGIAAVFERLSSRPAIVRTVASCVLIGLLAARFLVLAPDVVRHPREAYKDLASVIEGEGAIPVLAYVRNSEGLEHYLGRPVRHLRRVEDVAASVCSSRETVAYVMQPFALAPVDVPCLTRPGVRHHRFEQYARGDEMNVWLVPPAG